MTTVGWVVAVNDEESVTHLTADAADGATSLTVEMTAGWPTTGMLLVDETPIGYTLVDDETLALDDPLPDAYEDGYPVALMAGGKVSSERVADINFSLSDDEAGSVEALIPSAMHAYLPVGEYDDPVPVELELIDARWRIVTLQGMAPTFSAEFLDEAEPITPPESSPALAVTGGPDFFAVRSESVPASASIEYHVSTDPDFVPVAGDAATLSETTRSLVHFASAMPDGSAFAAGTAYTWRAIAVNAAGSAAPGNAATGMLGTEAMRSIIAAEVVAGFILTGRIEVGSAYFDADEGIVIPQPDGGTITLPVNGIDPATITAHIIARSATFEGNVTMYGLAQLYGTLRAASGITAPTKAPNVSRTWDKLEAVLSSPEVLYGLTDSGSVNWVSFYTFGTLYALAINKTTGGVLATEVAGSGVGNFAPMGGATRIGSSYYVLGRDYNRDAAWYVYILNSSFTKTGEWLTPFAANVYRPAIGNDGTNVVLARCYPFGASAAKPQVSRHAPADGTATGATVVCDLTLANPNLGSVYYGSADFGATRIVVATENGFFVFNTSGVRQSSSEWARAGSSKIRGMHWDGTVFHHLDDQGRVWHYTARPSSVAVDVKSTWYDGNGTTHETNGSPVETFTWPARAQLLIEVDPAPELELVTSDAANQARVYVGTSGGTLRLQATLPVGSRGVALSSLDTGSAAIPTSNGFESVTGQLGILESAGSGWRFEGDGGFEAGIYKSSDVRGKVDLVTGPPNANGLGLIPHSMGAVPSGVIVSSGNSLRTAHWSEGSSTSTNIGIFVRDKADGLVNGTTPVTYFAWWD